MCYFVSFVTQELCTISLLLTFILQLLSSQPFSSGNNTAYNHVKCAFTIIHHFGLMWAFYVEIYDI